MEEEKIVRVEGTRGRVGGKLYYCDKKEVVWESVCQSRTIPVYDANKEVVGSKSYSKTIFKYKDFPSYGKVRKNIPCNKKDEFYEVEG